MTPANTKHSMYILKALLFVIIGLMLFHYISLIFVEKTSFAKYKNYMAQDNVDILILGSSHPDAAIDPGQLEEAIEQIGYEADAFNYSIFGMRIEQMYFFMREVLKEQTPSLIVIDTYSFLPVADYHSEILARRAFDVFPFSLNKLEAIQYLTPGDHWSYYIPFIKYHSRWKELTLTDFQILYDETLWQMAGMTGTESTVSMGETDDYFASDTSLITGTRAINDTEKECLEKILALAAEKDIKLLFITVPFKEQLGMNSLQFIEINNYLRNEYIEGSDMQMLDMNLLWDKMDFGYGDLIDEGHCNASGAAKATACLADYLIDNYDMAELGGRKK